MSRRIKITQADFDNCILDLKKRNIDPSVSTIVREIGGSYTTIGGMFSKWQQENVEPVDTNSHIPDKVINDANELILQWWNRIQNDASISIRHIQETCAKQITQIQSEVSPLLEDLKKMESEIEDLKKSHETEVSTIKNLHELKVKNLKTELSGVTENRDYLKTSSAEKDKEAKKNTENYLDLHKKYTALVEKLSELK